MSCARTIFLSRLLTLTLAALFTEDLIELYLSPDNTEPSLGGITVFHFWHLVSPELLMSVTFRGAGERGWPSTISGPSTQYGILSRGARLMLYRKLTRAMDYCVLIVEMLVGRPGNNDGR